MQILSSIKNGKEYVYKPKRNPQVKIIMILATGTLLTFPSIDKSNDCFRQGYKILEKLATYHGPEEKGEDQGWVLKNSRIPIEVAGWYCE